MATGNMKFSVVLEAVTQAFNTAITQAKSNYTAATDAVRKDSAAMSSATQQAGVDLSKVFKATDATAMTTALRSVTSELNSAGKGATVTAEQMRQIGAASRQSLGELKGELKTAQAEFRALSIAKAAPQDLESAKSKVTALKVEITTAQAAYGQFQTAASIAMRRAAEDTQGAAEQAKAAGASIYGALNIRSSGSLRQEIAQITRELQQFKASSGAPAQEVARVTEAAQSRIESLKNEMRGIKPASDSAAASIKNMGASLLGVAAASEGLKSIIDTSMKFQAVNKQLEYAVGGAKQAGQEFGFVKETAKELGLDLIGAADGYSKLAAATKGTALEGKGTRDIFLGVSQAAATMGLSTDEANGVFLALSQIAGKGQVQMEELRGQLGERLPPAMKIAADSMGVTVQELNKMTANGLDATEFLSAFGPALQKSFANDAAKNVSTLQGRINGLRNEFKLFLNDLGESGVSSGTASIFGELTNSIQEVRKSLQSMDPSTVKAVNEAFAQMLSVVKQVFAILFEAVRDVNTVLDSMASLVIGVVNAFVGLDDAGEHVSFLTRVLQGVSVILGSLSDAVYGLKVSFAILTGTAQEFFSTIALGLSKVTFGELSKSLEDLSVKLGDAGGNSFARAGQMADQFKSQTIAAMDAAVGASEVAANKAADAHVEGAAKSAAAQGEIGVAAASAGGQVAQAATDAAQKLEYIGASAKSSAAQVVAAGIEGAQGIAAVGEAANTASQKIAVFAGANGSATLDLTKSVNETKQAFQTLAKDAGITLPTVAKSTHDLGLAMGTVAASSKGAADAIAKELPDAIEKLNSADLSEFTNSFIGGLNQAGASAEYTKARIIDLTSAATKSLGVDLGASLNGLTKSFQDSEARVKYLAGSFTTLKDSGVNANKLLADSLTAMLDKAKNPTEIKELISLWEQLGREGKITGQELADGLDQARNRLDALTPGVNSVTEAFKTFGLQTKAEASKLASTYGEAFDKISASGQASTGQLKEAFGKYAEAAVAANGGAADSMIQSKAEALGLKVQVDDTGKAIVTSMQEAAKSTQGLASGYKEAADAAVDASGRIQNSSFSPPGSNRLDADMSESDIAAQENQDKLDRRRKDLINKREGRDDDGFTTDGSGNRLIMQNQLGTRLGIINFLKEAGVTDMKYAKQVANDFSDNDGNVRFILDQNSLDKYGASSATSLSTAIAKAAENWIYKQKDDGDKKDEEKTTRSKTASAALQAPQQYTSAATAPAATKIQEKPPEKTVNVNFTLGGQTVKAAINASDEAAFLNILQKAKGLS